MNNEITINNIHNILIVADDLAQAQALKILLNNFGFEVLALCDTKAIAQTIARSTPDLILMDIVFPEDANGGLNAIEQLKDDGALFCPVIFISARDDFSTRLQAVRAGAQGFIVKPLNILALLEAIDFATSSHVADPYRVMIIDDDTEVTDCYELALVDAGFNVIAIHDPFQALHVIEQFQPDTILMDINMPACNGIELVKIIRQKRAQYWQLPIIFLTAAKDERTQLDALRSGGDDILTKPVSPDFLLKATRIRAERGREVLNIYRTLKESEHRFQTLSKSANDAIFCINDLSLMVFWNKAAERIFGYRESEVLGKPASMLFTHQSQSDLRDGIQAIITARQELEKAEFVAVRKDDSQFYAEISLSFWASNTQLQITAMVRDISEHKTRTTELTKAKEYAETLAKQEKMHSARLRAIITIDNQGHALRTPLNAILGFAQILQSHAEKPLTDQRHKSCVEHILSGGKHLLTLINEVLDLAKIEANKLELTIEPFPIDTTVEECLSLTNIMAVEKQIDIRFSKSQAWVLTDQTRMRQVLLKIISNAIKYNKPGGEVVIQTHTVSDNRLQVSVCDTGHGIPFNLLGQEHTDIEGAGIGLTLSKRLIEAMNGSIDCHSEVGVGSEFRIQIPTVEQHDLVSEDRIQHVSVETQIEQRDTKQLLYIEDNPPNLELMKMIANEVGGLAFFSAPTGEIGVDLAISHKPDIVITDITLPGMNGFGVLKKLREHVATNHIPIIALSANAMPQDIEHGKSVGFAHYLTKPINISEIIQVIKDTLGSVGIRK